MKKIITAVFMVFAVLGFSGEKDMESKVLFDRLRALKMINTIELDKITEDTVIVANVVGADELLRRLPRLEKKAKAKNIIVVFPDVDVVLKNMEKISKKVKKLTIVLLDKKVEVENMKNRDLQTFVEKGGDKKAAKLKNVKFYEVRVMAEDLPKIYENSLTKNFFEDEINQKYISEIYELEK